MAKQRRELAKEKSGGTGSDWSLLPHLHFLQHHHHPISHRNSGDLSRNSLKSIEEVHDEEDPLQEAMDEQLAVAGVAPPPTNLHPAPRILRVLVVQILGDNQRLDKRGLILLLHQLQGRNLQQRTEVH